MPEKRMPGLDGLRGLAILVVIAFHESYGYFPKSGVYRTLRNILGFGWVGVDLFFVLSGFLITGILLKALPGAHKSGAGQYFSTFYIRRTLRIFPIYYVYLAVAYRVFHYHPVGLPWYVFYVGNLKPGFGESDPGFVHLWSLSVEEQFYLIWPLLVLMVGLKRLAHICWAFIGGALALRLWLKYGIHFNPEGIHRITPTRIDTFAVGALVALYLRTHREWIIAQRRWFWTAAVSLIMVGGILTESPVAETLDWSLLAAGFGLLVAVVAAAGFAPMEWAPLRKIGSLSYSMYLFHQVVFMETIGKFAYLGVPHFALWGFIAGAVLTVIVAQITGVLIEGPFNRLKDRFGYQGPVRKPERAVAQRCAITE